MNLVLQRMIKTSTYIAGTLSSSDKGYFAWTLELPWKSNATGVSCIPEGLYKCRPYMSSKLGRCIEIMNVPNRTEIRIHKGNATSEIHGCILVGEMLLLSNTDTTCTIPGGMSSPALDKLFSYLEANQIVDFTLEIK